MFATRITRRAATMVAVTLLAASGWWFSHEALREMPPFVFLGSRFLLAGLLLAGQDVTAAPVATRGCGIVFQSYALFPHLTVWENIAFGLRREGMAQDKITERVEAMLKQGVEQRETNMQEQLQGAESQ